VAVLLVGGVTLGYAYYQSSSPQKTIAKMFGNFSKIKSEEFSGSITANIESDELTTGGQVAGTTSPTAKQKLNLSIDFSGASDTNDLANPKFQLALKFKGDMQESGSFSLDADLRFLEKNFYFKISNLPNIQIADLSPFSDKWIKLSGEELKNSPLLNQSSGQSQNAALKESKPLTTAQIQRLEQFITKHQFIKVTKKLADETLAGVPTKHFRFVFDKQAYKDFAKELSDNSDYKLDKTQLDKMNESLDSLNSADGEMWIGKKDAMLYKIVLNFNLAETSSSKASGKITFTMSFSNYNQPVTVTAPSPVLPFEEVLNQLLGGASSALDSASAKSRDALRLADVRQIMTALELSYNDNNKYPNTLDELIKPNDYLGQVPQSSTPPDGACTMAQNSFAYQLLKPDKYELSFCLGADTGGYGPGVHTASPEGIK